MLPSTRCSGCYLWWLLMIVGTSAESPWSCTRIRKPPPYLSMTVIRVGYALQPVGLPKPVHGLPRPLKPSTIASASRVVPPVFNRPNVGIEILHWINQVLSRYCNTSEVLYLGQFRSRPRLSRSV